MIQSRASKWREKAFNIDKGLTLVTDVNNALQDIVGSSRESADMAKAIQRATTEQTHVIKQITKDMENTKLQTKISHVR